MMSQLILIQKQIYQKDVKEVAMLHGDEGHLGADYVNITEEQKIKSLVLKKKESLKYLADSKYSKATF